MRCPVTLESTVNQLMNEKLQKEAAEAHDRVFPGYVVVLQLVV